MAMATTNMRIGAERGLLAVRFIVG